MKTCVFFTEKGGAAKTATSCQYAHHLAKEGKKVIYMDFDSQEGRGSALLKKQITPVASSYKIMTGEVITIEPAKEGITLVEGERALQTLEKQADKHNSFIGNLKTFLAGCSAKFDYCIIDCPPGADIRVKAALICGNYVVSPLKLAQEHVMGVGPVLGMIELIKQKMNPDLVFLGLLITQFEAKALQKHWLQVLAKNYSKALIGTKIGNRSAIQEAQQLGVAVSAIKKTAAKEAAAECAQVFTVLTEKMEAVNG